MTLSPQWRKYQQHLWTFCSKYQDLQCRNHFLRKMNKEKISKRVQKHTYLGELFQQFELDLDTSQQCLTILSCWSNHALSYQDYTEQTINYMDKKHFKKENKRKQRKKIDRTCMQHCTHSSFLGFFGSGYGLFIFDKGRWTGLMERWWTKVELIVSQLEQELTKNWFLYSMNQLSVMTSEYLYTWLV